MLTLAVGGRAIIAASTVQHFAKVEVQDADGTWQDWSAYLMDGTDWGESVDQPVSQARIILRRAEGMSSLAPLVTASPLNVDHTSAYAPAIDIGRGVRISTAIVPYGVTPVGGDYHERFIGRVDDVSWETDPIVLDCSDLGAWLMDTQIEVETSYGDGTALEDVIQGVVDDSPSGIISPVLYVPSSPGFVLPNKSVARNKVLLAIRELASWTGRDVRFRYDASDVSRLTLTDPDRARATVDFTVGPDEYRDVRRLSLSIANIRNVGILPYTTADGTQHTATVDDLDSDTQALSAGSVAKYGRRYFELESADAIDTLDEAVAYLGAVINDLAGPGADQEIESLYLPFVQLYDRATFLANGDHYDTDQTFAVVAYSHALQNGEIVTTLTCSGRVVGAYADWLRRLTTNNAQNEILAVTWQDSTDGTQRSYDISCGMDTGALYVHHRLWPIGAPGDPLDFADPDDPGELIIVGPDPTDRHFRFTLDHPDRAAQRFAVLVPRRAPPMYTFGTEVFKIVLDPAPPAMSAKMHALVTNATATVSVDVAASVSDWPVRVRIYEGSPNTTPLVDTTVSAPTTINSALFSVLAGRALPLRELLQWWTELTNVAGEEQWAGPEAANRDPLPQGYITIETNRADAKLRMVFDTDTDQIRVTVPSGKTKTWNAAALALAGSPVTYTVGDLLDDATTESALGTDEKRGTYLVEYTGGGQTVTIAPPFVLSGPLSAVSMVVTVTPGPTSYSIVWSGSGVTVNIDGSGYGTPNPSPIVVTRTASPHTYDFKQVGGNTNAPVHIDIPALTLGTGPLPAIDSFYSPSNSPYSFSQHTTTDIIDLVWTSRNTPSGATFNLDWALDGGAHTLITGVASPYSHQRTGTGGHGLDLVNAGTSSRMRYTLIMKDGSGNEVAVATLDIEADHV
jgi:hypothetical protein